MPSRMPHSLNIQILIKVLNIDHRKYFSRDQDNAIIRPLPRVKRLLSDNACLPHIIQVSYFYVIN